MSPPGMTGAARARLRSPIGVGLAGKVVEGVALVVFVSLLPRALSPEGFGELALAMSVVQIAAASTALGGPVTLSRFVGAREGPARAALARRMVGRMGRWRAALVTAEILVVAVPLVLSGRTPPGIAALVCLAVALSSAATLLAQAGLGLGRTAVWSYLIPVQIAGVVVFALALAVPFGAVGAAAAVAAASALTAAVAAAVAVPLLRGAAPGAALPPGLGRFSALQGARGALGLVVARGGVVAVSWLADSPAEVGFAGMAAGIALAGVYAVGQAFSVHLPSLAAHAASDPAAAERRSRRLSRAATLALAPVAVAGAAITEPVIALLAGDAFRGAATAVALGLAVLPMAPASALLNQAAALRLRPGAGLATAAVGAAVFVLVALAAVPGEGAAGASGAMVAGTAATLASGVILLPGALRPRLLVAAGAATALTTAIALLM